MSDSAWSAKNEQLHRDLHNSQRQTALMMQLAQSAAEPGDIGHMVRSALEVILSANGWILGQFWIVSDQENLVRCAPWYFATAQLPEFRATSMDRRFSKGVELPGRVWATGCPLLIPELEAESGLNFTRKSAALKCGLRSGFSFAIKNGPFITGIFEFFDIKPIPAGSPADDLFYEKLGMYISTLIAQRETEQAWRQQEDLNKIVLNHAYNAFISINEASLITQWTSRATDLFGWESDEVLGKPLQEVIIPERYRDAHMRGFSAT
jgi:PAS domain-containing protein